MSEPKIEDDGHYYDHKGVCCICGNLAPWAPLEAVTVTSDRQAFQAMANENRVTGEAGA